MRFTRVSAGPQWKNLLLRGLPVLVFAALASGQALAASGIVKQADGTYLITGTDYRARVSTQGMLDSLQLSGTEFLNGPLLAGSVDWRQLKPEDWKVFSAEQPQADTLKVTLALPAEPKNAVLAMTYRDAPDGLRVTMQRLSNKWGGSVGWRVGDHVVSVEPLARPGFGYNRLPGNGLVYALPLSTTRNFRDMRYYFDNHHALDATYMLNDGPYNIGVSGQAVGEEWGRGLLDLHPLELIFAPVRSAAGPSTGNAAPQMRRVPAAMKMERGLPFTLTADAPESMSPVGAPAGFHLKFRPDALLSGPQTLTYRLLDFQDKETLHGTQTITPKNLQDDAYRFYVQPKNSGWYRVIASLRPAGKPDALPSEDEVECGIYTPTPGVTDPPVKSSVVGITGALGLRCIRLSLYVNQLFSTREKSPLGDPKFDWKPMDEQVYPFFADCVQYHMTGFCQLNARPAWADPAAFEALIKAITARYKAVNHLWEIENEPQDRYTPENYVTQALAPAFRGAHSADPAAQVMGPAIVRVDLRWFERFFAAQGGDFLDILSTHSYIGHNRSWEEHGNAEDFRALSALMRRNGLGKPIWQTEQGFTWNNHPEMPRLHAAYVVRMFALAASVGIPNEHCYYFYGVFNGFEPWYLYERSPNRSGMATRIFAEQTAGMKFQREIPMGKFAHAIVYTDGKRDTVICWLDDFSAEVHFKIEADTPPQIVDIMGAPIVSTSGKTGLMSLTLDGYPRYIHLSHGANFTPVERFPDGPNLASSKTGAIASASSFAGSPADAANLNDGTWHLDDGQTDQKIWVGKPNAPLPQWAAVRFAAPRRIDTIVAVTPATNGWMRGPRYYQLQAEVKGVWQTLREVRNNTLEWALYAHFPPVQATAVRLVFLGYNNGQWRDDTTFPFGDTSPRVYELEAYGPPDAPQRAGN